MSRFFTIDFAIVAAYLLITLVVGIVYGRGITTMRQYVIGDHRRYSVIILVAALLATSIGGGTLGDVERVFKTGLLWVVTLCGLPINRILIARYIAPHVGRFRKKLSVGEMMGDFYGKPGQVVTGIGGTLSSIGVLGAQIGAIGYLFKYFLGWPNLLGIFVACGIVVIYSSFGGIRAVTATDIIQFVVIMVAFPIIAIKAFWHAGGYSAIVSNLTNEKLALLDHEDFLNHVVIFILMVLPHLNPAVMQRFLMCRDAEQAYDTFRVAGFIHYPFILCTAIIGFSVFSMNSSLEAKLSLPYAIDMVLSEGVKGFAIVSLFALIMSSADSYLHAGTVSLIHDGIQPLLKRRFAEKKELKLIRISTFLLGAGAIVAAASFKSIIDLLLVSASFWLPVVFVPLIAGIVAYRASVRTFIIAAISGAATTIIWNVVIVHYISIGAAIPGLLANLLAFVIARRFDKPEDLHFGEEELKDPRWRKYVELYRQKREKEGRAALNPVALISDCGRALRVWLGDLLEEWLPTPHKVRHFCRWSGLRWQIPYDRIAGLTLTATPPSRGNANKKIGSILHLSVDSDVCLL